MIWNVYRENANTKKIEVYNIFDHASFKRDVQEAYTTCKTQKEFVEKLKRTLMYYFWSKCEWEVIITDWPTHVSVAEVERMSAEIAKYEADYGHKPYSTGVNLKVAEKIDVYNQVMLNWEAFVNYVWFALEGKVERKEIWQ